MIVRTNLLLMIVLGLLLAFTGCNAGDVADGNDIPLNGSPEDTVRNFWSAFKASDMETATSYVTAELEAAVMAESPDNLNNTTAIAIRKGLLASYSLNITDYEEEAETAKVYAELTHPDFNAFYTHSKIQKIDFDPEYAEADEAELMEIIREALEEMPTFQKENFDFTLIKKDDRWLISDLPDIDYF